MFREVFVFFPTAMKNSILLILFIVKSSQLHERKNTCTFNTLDTIWGDNKGSLTRVVTFCPLPTLYRLSFFPFWYFYFLGSPSRWFPKRCERCEFRRAGLPPRIEDVPSQSFIDGANSSRADQEVETGAQWKIQRSTEWAKNKHTCTHVRAHTRRHNCPRLTCALLLSCSSVRSFPSLTA